MRESYIPRLKLNADITETKLNTLDRPMRMDNIFKTDETPEFKDVFASMANNVNETMNAPDRLLEGALTGNNTDIHDVMIAMSKAELTVNVATQMTSKVVQAYEKIMSIQL